MKLIYICLLLIVGAYLAPLPNHAGQGGKVRLFILSGQSNMARLDPDVSFTPAVKKAFPQDEVIVVKSAQGGQPIRRWYKGAKSPDGAKTKGVDGDLYDLLMTKVKSATKNKTIDSIALVWMQGESDAKRGTADSYEANLRGLIAQLRDDLKRPDVAVVIGRLSEFKNGEEGWDKVRAAQVKVAEADPLASWVDTDKLNAPKVALHYSLKGYEELGRRFAAKSVELVTKKSKLQ